MPMSGLAAAFFLPPMSPSRRTLISRALRTTAALGASLALCSAFAQSAKPIRIMVGFPAGGGSDAIARLLAAKLRTPLGTEVLVENRPGAGGQIAAQALKAAPADGSVLFLSHDHTISILPLVVKNPGYAPETDFVPVAGSPPSSTPLPFRAARRPTALRLRRLGQSAGRRQGRGRHSGPRVHTGVSGEGHCRQVQARFGVRPLPRQRAHDGRHAGQPDSVPASARCRTSLKTTAPARCAWWPCWAPSARRRMPDVPTFDELGLKGFEDLPYYGIYAPKGTPAAELKRLADGVAKVLALPEVRTQLTDLGLTVEYMTGEQLAKREHAYTKAWTQIIQTSGFKPQ
jgi:tripartite-type tricarboxylate transporter receptor subunit TctC